MQPRLVCRYRNLALQDKHMGIIIEVLQQVRNTCDAYIVLHARGLLSQALTVQFVVCLKMLYIIWSLSVCVRKALQSLILNIAQCETLSVSMVPALSDLRENAWSNIRPEQKIYSLFYLPGIVVECNRPDKISSAKRRHVD